MESENAIIDMIPPGKALDTLIWDRLFNRESILSVISDCSMFDGVHSPFLQALVGFNAFSTSDLEAMFVVQALVQKHNRLEFHSSIIRDGEGGVQHWAKFLDVDTGKMPEAFGETLAHAICLAALKYVGLGSDFDPETSAWIGRKVYAVRLEDPPYLEEGIIKRWHENGSDIMVQFYPKHGPIPESLVTRFALESGAVALTTEKAIAHAYDAQFNVVKCANKDAVREMGVLSLIRKLGGSLADSEET